MLAGGSIQLRVAPMSLTLLAPSPEPAISASPSLTLLFLTAAFVPWAGPLVSFLARRR